MADRVTDEEIKPGSRRIQAALNLCDKYRANCDPTSVQAQVAEIFRSALTGTGDNDG